MKSLGLFLAGLVAAALCYWGGQQLLTLIAQAQAGATAYGWLGSPAAPESRDNRAAVLERLIQRERAAEAKAAQP